MAAISATVVPEFLHALRLKKREDPTSPALQLEVEGLGRKNGTESAVEGAECPTTGVFDMSGSVESEFLSLLGKAVPLSTIRAMVAEQHRQAEEEMLRVKKSLDGALKTYRYCRQKTPQLQTELTQVNTEIAKRSKELEVLREEVRETCNKEERLRRKRDRLGTKYEDMKKRAKFCKEALAILPLVYDQKKPGELEEEDDAIQEELSDGDDELPPSPPPDHTPSSVRTHSPQERIVAEEEEDSNPAPPLEDIPNVSSIASDEGPSSSPSRPGGNLQSPSKKEVPRLMLSPRRSISMETGNLVKSPIRSAPPQQKDPTSPVLVHKSPEHKVVPTKRTPIEHPNTDDLEDELDDLDDLDDLEGGYMGVPVVDDEDSDDSDASGHLVIETMGLQVQKARNSVEELDQDYMPSGMDDML